MADKTCLTPNTPEESARLVDHFEHSVEESEIDWPLVLFWLAAIVLSGAFWTGVIFWIWS